MQLTRIYLAFFVTTLMIIALTVEEPIGQVHAFTDSANSVSSSIPAFSLSLRQQMTSLAVHFDAEKARSRALNSTTFQSLTRGHSPYFNSIFQRFSWSTDASGLPTSLWNSVNVVYSYQEKDGFHTNIVVTMDPSLTGPIQVTTQNDLPQFFGGGTDNPNWSGFELSKSWLYQSVPVYEVYASWTMEAIYKPSQGCYLHYCGFSVWDGLTNKVGGGNGIVQGGTGNTIDCNLLGCTYANYFWYELWPNDSVSCGNINPGDSMASDVLNTGILSGGSPTTEYHIWVYDYTTQQTCWLDANFGQMGTPYLGDFLSERQGGCGGYCGSGGYYRLPIFANPVTNVDTVTMANCGLDLSQSSWYMPCNTPFSNGWYNAYFMVNNGCRNIYLHSVGTDNSFAQDWLTSCGT